jgi:hypothetical protein
MKKPIGGKSQLVKKPVSETNSWGTSQLEQYPIDETIS